jgi:hypothetical protein
LDAVVSEVPPTAVTYCDEAGQETPKPLSPEDAVIATPGWLKLASAARIVESSAPP